MTAQLDYFDQAALELFRATGRGQLIQGVWIYDHPIDPEGLAGFHERLGGTGLLGRLVERSPVPFSRPRWVVQHAPQVPIVTAPAPRSREQLMDWVDEIAALPIDPERGPGWILGVLPLTDGGTVVSLVMSHCLVDGGGALLAALDAILGNRRDFGYGAPESRRPATAVLTDLRDSAREVPRLLGGLVGAGRLARQARRNPPRRPPVDASADGGDTGVTIPAAVAILDTDDWDARAQALGGNTYSLVAGYAATVAGRLGRRRRSDGNVTLVIAGSSRQGFDDDRALAMTFANAAVDAATVSRDLTAARSAIRAARDKAKTDEDPSSALLPLVPWFPRRIARSFVAQMFSYQDSLPVSCSNVSDFPSDITRADGTPAEHFFARSVDQSVTLRDLTRSNGTMVLVSGRINGRIWLSVEAYQLGEENSRERLHQVLADSLADFGLSGMIL